MSARTLFYSTSTLSLYREILYTLAQMREEPLAAPYLPIFEKHRDDLQQLLLQELAILGQLADAQATVDRVDGRLDRFVLKVIRTVEDATDGNTRKQLRKKLLKGKSVSRFRRPVLGRQLKDMADWSTTLSTCGVATLVSLAGEADALCKIGKDASDLRDKAQADNRNFRDVGARKQFVDALNASRKEVSGALAKLPFQDPSLPQDFADGFFLSEPPRDEEETIDEVKESIASLETQLAEEKSRLAKMELEAAEAAKTAQEEKEKEDQAAALEAQATELLKQAAALKAKK